MFIRPAFYLENRAIPHVDFRRPEEGNPGCGGTEYLFSALPYYLIKMEGERCKPVLIANCDEKLPLGPEVHHADDIIAAARLAKELGCSHFVFRPYRLPQPDLYACLDELGIVSIAWLHVTPTSHAIRGLAKSSAIKAVVCVEHEQHESLRDTPLWSKLTYIVNGFDMQSFDKMPRLERKECTVAYLGAVVPQKGFHLLARAWPMLLQKRPDASLWVIGSGKLYKEGAVLGSWGLAEREYEDKEIKPYLADKDGQPLLSVKLLGTLGKEKFDYLRRATVAVANPSGLTENCPGSALEIQACGTPIVSGAYYGMLDTILDGKTGLLGRTVKDLADNIYTIISNKELASFLGNNGPTFVHERYAYEKVCALWMQLFIDTYSKKFCANIPLKTNIFQNYKIFIYINAIFQKKIGKLMSWPSIFEVKDFLRRMYHGLRRIFNVF